MFTWRHAWGYLLCYIEGCANARGMTESSVFFSVLFRTTNLQQDPKNHMLLGFKSHLERWVLYHIINNTTVNIGRRLYIQHPGPSVNICVSWSLESNSRVRSYAMDALKNKHKRCSLKVPVEDAVSQRATTVLHRRNLEVLSSTPSKTAI